MPDVFLAAVGAAVTVVTAVIIVTVVCCRRGGRGRTDLFWKLQAKCGLQSRPRVIVNSSGARLAWQSFGTEAGLAPAVTKVQYFGLL